MSDKVIPERHAFYYRNHSGARERQIIEELGAAEAALSEARQNKWPLGDRPNPCCGYSCNGVDIYGDEKSIKAAGDAFHYAAQLPEYREQFETQVAQLQATICTLRGALKMLERIIVELYPGHAEPDAEHLDEYRAVWSAVVAARAALAALDEAKK